jgi:gamma-glutamylcyclotransferase (GGCT)/AIG2-like uncharacterized protein YtfP
MINERDSAMVSESEKLISDVLGAEPQQRLFVYGTLMSTAAAEYGLKARSRLLLEAPNRLPAQTSGQLYELGRYPGLVINTPGISGSAANTTGTTDIVHGQLMVLADPAVTLAWLDEYEAISPEPGADNEYARCLQTVTITGGRTLRAWTYIYLKSVQGLARVAGGLWR